MACSQKGREQAPARSVKFMTTKITTTNSQQQMKTKQNKKTMANQPQESDTVQSRVA